MTTPFVLSWSMLEAMAAGALLVGSRTPPVQDVIIDGVNGRLVDFFDTEALVETLADALARPQAMRPLREAGRAAVVQHFDLQRVCLPAQLALVDRVATMQR